MSQQTHCFSKWKPHKTVTFNETKRKNFQMTRISKNQQPLNETFQLFFNIILFVLRSVWSLEVDWRKEEDDLLEMKEKRILENLKEEEKEWGKIIRRGVPYTSPSSPTLRSRTLVERYLFHSFFVRRLIGHKFSVSINDFIHNRSKVSIYFTYRVCQIIPPPVVSRKFVGHVLQCMKIVSHEKFCWTDQTTGGK